MISRYQLLQKPTLQTETLWEWLIAQNDFKRAIKTRGYYQFQRDILLGQYCKCVAREQAARASASSNTKARYNASSLNIERLSQTPKILNENELYLVKAGAGNFVVFDMREFLPPFLSLNWTEYSVIEELPVRLPRDYQRLASQFRTQWNEQSLIKALHYCGAFSSLVERISKLQTHKYVSGPSGSIMSHFPFWMRRNGVNSKNSRLHVPFVYQGIVDLDECLYPTDTNIIIPIEAKLQHFPDLAWHKLAFPCYRFIDQPQFENAVGQGESWVVPTVLVLRSDDCRGEIAPTYCAYHAVTRQAIIHVFPRVKVHSGMLRSLSSKKVCGIVLNEKSQMVPVQTFTVDMSWI